MKNLGLVETVNLAQGAVPNSRKVNGKTLAGDINLNAGDVGAFPILRSIDEIPTLGYNGPFRGGESTNYAKGVSIGDSDYGQIWVNSSGRLFAQFSNNNGAKPGGECVYTSDIAETVNLAKGAYPKSGGLVNGNVDATGYISGKGVYEAPGIRVYSSINKPSLEELGAFPGVRNGITDNGKFSDMRETGIYIVYIADPNSVTDLPVYNGYKIYSYGFLVVFRNNDQQIHQTYYSHHGDIATRQTWDGPAKYLSWTIQYSTKNKPSATDVGVYTKAESDSRYADKTNIGVANLRLGSVTTEGGWTNETKSWTAPAGNVLVGINTTMWSSGRQHLAGVHYRPVQAYINNAWVTISTI
ncbi:hypothetical protein [Photorhabdus bodei]|uniref:hypothetical protein n=1 Tax=Photorhabdus bodei TaxID=2029681 RepID=UPI001EFE53B6|nr:hypothetical protein [Photorhabdus bodei]